MSEFTSIADILKNMTAPGPEEKGYRRGYHQGYDQAIADIFSRLPDYLAVREAHTLATLHCDAIAVWRTLGTDHFIAPPPFNAHSLQETLQLRQIERPE